MRRLVLLGAVVAWAMTLGTASGGAAAAPVIASVADIGMTVHDLDRSVQFFTEVLEFRVLSEAEYSGEEWERLTGVFGLRMRVARLALGDEQIELTQYLAPEGRPIPADAKSNDLAFQHIAIITPDMDRAYARLREHHVRHASSGPQTLPEWNPNAGGIKAFYFKDPDGHALEVLQFPPGKGDAKWPALETANPGSLFLGIDHTAIVVGETAASLRFYRDTLGLRVVGESENFGTEQEHLNNVFGARVRITALRAEAGPGVELLEYLAPPSGRAAPIDSAANDLWHWHVRMVALRKPPVTFPASRGEPGWGVVRWVSPGWAEFPTNPLFASGISLKDPDGHVVQVVIAGPGIGEASP
ncbi:MAG: VOC family protein [Phycisphaerae bacterium]|nr:VOC family protein [Phycisphaerae bacterium]